MAFNAQMLDETGKAIVAALKAMNGESSEDTSESGSTYRPLITDATGREILAELKKITPGGNKILEFTVTQTGPTSLSVSSSMSTEEMIEHLFTKVDVEGVSTYIPKPAAPVVIKFGGYYSPVLRHLTMDDDEGLDIDFVCNWIVVNTNKIENLYVTYTNSGGSVELTEYSLTPLT